jgi:hypothetical protein
MAEARLESAGPLADRARGDSIGRAAHVVGNLALATAGLILLLQLRLLWERAYAADEAMRHTIYSNGDDWEYQSLAINLLTGHGFVETIIEPLGDYRLDPTSTFGQFIGQQVAQTGTYFGLQFYRAPGFPLLLSAAYAVFGTSTVVSRLLLAGLAWLTSIWLLLIGRFAGGPLCWLAGSLVAIGFLYHPMIDLQRTLTEIPSTFFITLFALCYMLYLRRSRRWLLLAAAAAFACAVYTRSVFLISLPLILAYEWLRNKKYMSAAIFALIVLLPVAAWSAYASISSRHFIAFTTQSEIAFPQYNNIDVLNGVGPNHFMQGGWNPGWLQDKQGVWYSDYRYAPQPGENGWVKGLTFWRENYRQLPALFYVKLRAGLWLDSGNNPLAPVFLACIGALLLTIGLRVRPRWSSLDSAMTARYALMCQLALVCLLAIGVLPFKAVLLFVWPLMLAISLLVPYGAVIGPWDDNPAWFLAFIVGHILITVIFGAEQRFHQPLDAVLVLFGLLVVIRVLFYPVQRLRDIMAVAPA